MKAFEKPATAGGTAVCLLGIRVDDLPSEALIAFISQAIKAGERAVLAYINVYALNLAYEQPWFRSFLNEARLTFCDGFGVKWGARLAGRTLAHRNTPPDWFPALAAECDRQGHSLYLLGGRPGVAERCARMYLQRFPGLKIAGTHHGYFDKTTGSAENRALLTAINNARPDLLILGLGMPTQERWLAENWPLVEARVALPVGAMFDYLTGEVRRAPRWMTDHGLEWLGRLLVEPRRLAQRYLVGIPLFLWRVLLWRKTKQRGGI